MHKLGLRRRSLQGWETCLRVFVCLMFMIVSGLGTFGFSGMTETEERAGATSECLLETAHGARVEIRQERFTPCRDVNYQRFVRLVGYRLAHHGRGRIRCCETAPLPLRC